MKAWRDWLPELLCVGLAPWIAAGVVIAVLSVWAVPTQAGEIPCPVPIVAHVDTDEYRTHEVGKVYAIRLQAPDADPGELISCSLQIGTVLLLTIQNPAPLGCYREDVSPVQGRHPITRWCSTAEGDTEAPVTQGKFRVPGPKLF